MSNVRPFPGPSDDESAYIDRSVPADLAAEQAVLSGCMYDPANVERAAVLDRSDFYHPAHQLVWDVIRQQVAKQQPTEPIALRKEIADLGQLRMVEGGAYLFTISQAPSVSVEYYAGIVQEKAILRRKADLAVRINVEVGRGASPEQLDRLIQEHIEDEKNRTGGRTSTVDALLAEMLDTAALDNMASLEPLVGDLLHLDTLARIIGPSGHMKSFVTIDVAGHVGTGRPWHGKPVRQGTVVYLVAEGARGIRKRVRAWEKHYRIPMTDVLFLPRPVQAMDPEWLTLIEACRRVEPALIVIDTQARVSVGVEENSAKELGLVIDRMEQLRAATGACVLVIHHTGHQGEHGRGSTSAKGALQSELHVSKKGDSVFNTVVTVKTGKQKDDEEGPDLDFGLHIVDVPGEVKPDGRPVTSLVLVSLDAVERPLLPPQPGSVEFVVAELDRAAVPSDWGGRRVAAACVELGIRARKDKIEEAVRVRKMRGEMPDLVYPRNVPPTSPAILDEKRPPAPGDITEKPQAKRPPNARGDIGGTPQKGNVPPPSLLREGGRPPGDTPCTRCGEPLQADWQARGYDAHVICNTTGDAA